MINLNGKKLLMMGGGAFAKDVRRYADLTGFTMIALGKTEGVHSKFSHKYYSVDTTDIEGIVKLIKEKQVDGIFVGASEVNIRPAIKIAERTGLHFYATQKQWDILADKEAFKNLLKTHGLPIIREYSEDVDPATVEYPVIVKPVDGSGACGITVCRKANELKLAVEYAKSFSFCGRVIIESFLEGMDDTFIRYHFQNGNYSVSSSFDKYSDFSEGGFTGMPLIYTHPTKHLKAYMEKCDGKMQSLFREIGLQNGVITLQGFVDENDDFYFYEAGYRLGGSQSYIFTDAVNQSNSLYYMINHALTGQMADYSIADRDNPWFDKACCNQYIPLKSGTLTAINGLSELRSMPGVLNVTQMCPVGTVIEQSGNLNQVCLRMHLMADSWKDMDKLLSQVDDTLQILDENGNDMRMRHIRAINDVIMR
jgi:biotin carboxylase